MFTINLDNKTEISTLIASVYAYLLEYEKNLQDIQNPNFPPFDKNDKSVKELIKIYKQTITDIRQLIKKLNKQFID